MLNYIIKNKELFEDSIINNTTHLYDNLKNNFILKNSYDDISKYLFDNFKIKYLKITMMDQNRNINNTTYDTLTEECDNSLIVPFSINFNHNIKIAFDVYANDSAHLEKLKKKKETLNTLLNFISSMIFTTYLQEKIDHLKLQDNITGLYNRVYLTPYLEKSLPLAKRENKKIAFLMIGIDHLKAVIDEFDYETGDKVLIALAQSLTQSLRSSDVVVRLDADEFFVVLPNIINSDNAIMIAEKIIKNFSECKVVVNEKTQQTLQKTICAGITIYPDDSVDVDEILKNADISLYEARNKGRSSFFKYSKEETSTIELF